MHDRAPADLFARLPSHFRSRDAEQGRALEALMGLFAEELGYLEQDIDQLYDNWFVETCEPWVLPYIAALVGASPMREIGTDQAGLLRAYIANLLQYRQAKGTAAVIEQVARDVSGWSVVAVEFFQRLATAQHVNQVRRHVPVFADLRNAAARSSRSPFSSMAHAAAAGPPAGWSGRFNIPHLGLFIWRHAAAPIWPVEDGKPGYLGGAQPRLDVPDPGQLRFDPLGRDLPLVNRPAPDLSVAARMTARTLPAPLSRDLVHAALNAARSTGTSPDHWFEQAPPFRVRLEGIELGPDKLYCCNLEADETGAWRRPANSGEVMVDPVLGRLSLHAADEGKAVETGYALAQAFDIGGGAYDRRASLEQWLADFVIAGEPPPWQIGVSRIDGAESDDPDQAGPVVASMREAVNRWNAFATDGARGIIAVLDNATYSEALDNTSRILLPRGSQLAIVAAAWPIEALEGGVRRRTPGVLSPMHRRPVLLGSVMIDAADADTELAGSLVLDGLLIGGDLAASAGGDLGALRLYNCTIGATGSALQGALRASAGNARMSVLINRCIVSRIELPLATGKIDITRSMIGEDLTADAASAGSGALILQVPQMDATIMGSTLFGRTECRSIQAENSILTGRVRTEFRQSGCVRFCYVTQDSALPRRYRCVPSAADNPKPRPVFVSTRFQDIGFGQLSPRTPQAILEGAEDGMEMGVGFANREPARRANIRDAIAEFSPVGLVPGLIDMT
jgi:hypothetical protein